MHGRLEPINVVREGTHLLRAIRQINISDITPFNPPRTVNLSGLDIGEDDFEAEWEFDKLYTDIVASGIKVPLRLYRLKGENNFMVIDGLKRLAVAEQLGLERIPAIINISDA